jgi:hypothetical protein
MMHRPLNRARRSLAPTLILVALAWGCEDTAKHAAVPIQVLQALPQAHSDPRIEFSQITDVAVDSRGHIYASDALGEIVVMTEEATLMRRFGRRGFGPGEFESISTVHLLSGDTLYVYDGSASRATVYLPHSAQVAYTVRFPQAGFAFPVDVRPRSDGFLLAHFRRINGDVPTSGQRQDDVVRVLNRDGSVHRDSAVIVAEPESIEIREGPGRGFFFPRFARETLVRWGPDGRIYSIWTDSARVEIHDAKGKAHGSVVVNIPFPRLPITAGTIDSLAQRNAQGGFTRRTLEQAFRERWQTWPLVQDMLVDDRSRIWIQPVTQGPQSSWLAFDEQGRQIATLQLPRGTRPRLIRGDRMYAVSTDSLDVESLVVYRLTPTSTRTREDP